MTQKASQDAELNGQALNPISRTQSKRSFQRILGHHCIDFKRIWTHFLMKQEEEGSDTSHGVDARQPWLADLLRSAHR